MTVREAAFKILQKVEKGAFSQDLMEEISDLPDKDRGLLTQLVYGTIRYQGAIDTIIQNRIPIANRIILRLAAYQMFFLSKIPQYAIVNESVELAKKYCSRKTAGFINAVLRNWGRKPPVISDKLSHPQWLIERWSKMYGKPATEELCNFNNSIPPIYVRFNSLKEIPQDVSFQFKETGRPGIYEVVSQAKINSLKGYVEGMFHVQDIAQSYVLGLLDARPGNSVLDICASPGGKTCTIAEIMDGKGSITAVDISREKVKLIEENCARLGVSIVKTVIGDGRKISLGLFDRVLVDAPCSNTGVFRRRIEARWRLKQADFQRLAAQQLELLENAKKHLKKDGILVYSTCSIDKSENEEVVDKFAKKYQDIKLVSSIKKLPQIDNMDGVFAARLVYC